MTAEIMALDNALARAGETVTFKRGAASSTVKAVVRGIRAEELIGTATMSDLMVIISPTGMGIIDKPTVTDKVVVKGIGRQVKFADHIYVGDVWVRSNVVVGG